MANRTTPTRITEADARKWTTEILEKFGWYVVRVDTRHPFKPQLAVDFLGVADLLAMKTGEGLMLVQLTADSHPRAKRSSFLRHIRKVLGSDNARRWVAAGGQFSVFGWRPEEGAPDRRVFEMRTLTVKDFVEAEVTA